MTIVRSHKRIKPLKINNFCVKSLFLFVRSMSVFEIGMLFCLSDKYDILCCYCFLCKVVLNSFVNFVMSIS